jgi:hypothetical protein
MDDIKIITVYCIIEDIMRKLGHQSHTLAQISDAEVLTVAVVSSMYFHNNHERALFVMKGLRYLTKPISTSRFSRRLHALAGWLEYVVELVGSLFAQGDAFIIDSLPVPVCKRVRAFRCRKVKVDGRLSRAYFGYCAAKKWRFFGWRLHLVCCGNPAGVPVSFQMLPGGWHDLTAIHELTLKLPPGAKVYADKGYISKVVEAALLEYGLKLVPVRKANMKQQNTFEEWCDLRWYRPAIETANSQLEKMGIQHLHARTNLGFSIKVLASVLALACINLI